MPKSNEPSEVPQEVTLTLKDLVDLVKSLNQAGTLDAQAIADIVASSTAKAVEAVAPAKEPPYHGISNFNPEGELAHPRPALEGDVYWAGYLLRGDELTRDEILLTNQLQPGDYEIQSRSHTTLPFRVKDLDPGSRTTRRLLVLFPCTTADQRQDLPTMVEMLRQVLPVPTPA